MLTAFQVAACEAIALDLMEQHGLTGPDVPEDKRWTFKWDNAKRRAGQCNETQRVISISRPITELWGAERMRDTILHEIAHAIAGARHRHDRVWQAIAASIGARPVASIKQTADMQLPPTRRRRRTR